ncbi:MAG TPA: phosphotransferase [Ktedonobacterales bacterium]|nr:phosphotransferase [Ktedonobacterales bacterium]
METLDTEPSHEAAQAILDIIAPGSHLQGMHPLPGSFSNSTYLAEALDAHQTRFPFVIRRYAQFGSYDRGEKARREYSTLALLQAHGVPAPLPLYLDDTGAILGTSGIVVSFAPGKQNANPATPVRWARTLAIMLARIHAISCEQNERGERPAECLLDGNSEAIWFAQTEAVPDSLLAHEDGPSLWREVHALRQQLRPVPARLLHVDYWPGNILWQGEQISAVLDWEEAAYGDPGYDVAYGYLHLQLLGLEHAARTFLEVYEVEAEHRVENLGFWELAAAARPMPDPARLIPQYSALGAPPCTSKVIRERLRQFIATARQHAEL